MTNRRLARALAVLAATSFALALPQTARADTFCDTWAKGSKSLNVDLDESPAKVRAESKKATPILVKLKKAVPKDAPKSVTTLLAKLVTMNAKLVNAQTRAQLDKAGEELFDALLSKDGQAASTWIEARCAAAAPKTTAKAQPTAQKVTPTVRALRVQLPGTEDGFRHSSLVLGIEVPKGAAIADAGFSDGEFFVKQGTTEPEYDARIPVLSDRAEACFQFDDVLPALSDGGRLQLDGSFNVKIASPATVANITFPSKKGFKTSGAGVTFRVTKASKKETEIEFSYLEAAEGRILDVDFDADGSGSQNVNTGFSIDDGVTTREGTANFTPGGRAVTVSFVGGPVFTTPVNVSLAVDTTKVEKKEVLFGSC